MTANATSPLVIQSDHTFMLEVQHPQYIQCRDFLATFTELVKSPEFIHTYKVTPLSIWNAAALNIEIEEIIDQLSRFSRYDIPGNILSDIKEWHSSYGKLVMRQKSDDMLILTTENPSVIERITNDKTLSPHIFKMDKDGLWISKEDRGIVKFKLIKIGYPVKDLCGYTPGKPINISLRSSDKDGNSFTLRKYQWEAVDAFYRGGSNLGGSGVIVLPCGAGKTIIGLGVISKISAFTLIVTTNNVSVHQWRDELLSRTDIPEDQVGEYTGRVKEIRPITIVTYQMLTYRKSKEDDMANLKLFTDFDWGLIIYDEVHLLPAPVFRATTGIQAKRRLGLTATLIREDGKEEDVFALIGPKRFDLPWKTLEGQGFIAEAICTEYRINLSEKEEIDYAHASKRERFRVAAENSRKQNMVQELIINHPDDSILVIGQYISQLEQIAKFLELPLITGKLKHEKRQVLYADFKKGKIKVLVVSKVANFALDLPDASILIQISGTYGSRQEEAQRLGRILRPKKKRSHFYTLVSKDTDEQKFAVNRQLFLVEQGYKYRIRYY